MDRLNEKLDLLVKLGRLFGPMQRLAEFPDEYDEQERAETIARYFSEHQFLIQDFAKFSTGEPGRDCRIKGKKFIRALGRVESRIEQEHDLRQIVTEHLTIARDAINAVPVPRSSIILDAGTPFTAYCKLRSLSKGGGGGGGGGGGSRLFAGERGINKYRLLIVNSLHDRWLVLDSKRIYALGGFGQRCCVKGSVYDNQRRGFGGQSPEDRRHPDAVTEWFGPSTPTHH